MIRIEYIDPQEDSDADLGSEESDQEEPTEYVPARADEKDSKAMIRKFHMHQRLVWGHRFQIGRAPETCLQACDKSASGLETDGCVCRWAASHFGQAPAGSGLNCMAMCLQRHMVQRSPHPGERRGASARTCWARCGWMTLAWRTSWQVRAAPPTMPGAARGVPHMLEPPAGSQAQPRVLDRRVSPAGRYFGGRQALEYGGFVIDSHLGVISVTLDKLGKLEARFREWADQPKRAFVSWPSTGADSFTTRWV